MRFCQNRLHKRFAVTCARPAVTCSRPGMGVEFANRPHKRVELDLKRSAVTLMSPGIIVNCFGRVLTPAGGDVIGEGDVMKFPVIGFQGDVVQFHAIGVRGRGSSLHHIMDGAGPTSCRSSKRCDCMES